MFPRAHRTELKNFASYPASKISARYLMTSVGHVPPINIILKGELAFGNEHNTQKSIFFCLLTNIT